MKWTIAAKIASAFACALAILIVIGVICHRNIGRLIESARWVEHTHQVVAAVDQVLVGVGDAEAGQFGYLISGDRQYLQPYEGAHTRTEQALARVRSLISDSPEQQRRLALLEPLLASRFTELRRLLDVREKQGFEAAARELGEDRGKSVMIEVRQLVSQMRAHEADLLSARAVQERARADLTEATIVWGLCAVAAFLAVAGALLTLNIARPLSAISAAAQRIATGDLSASLPVEAREDEVGVLMRSFQRMTQALSDMSKTAERIAAGDLTEGTKSQSERDAVGVAFSAMRDSLRRSTGELREAAAVLAASASEILAATTQVAAGAAETATAVTQTTTTVEEVKQTAQVSTQKARLVSETALKAAQTSQEGRRAVEEAIDGMHRIQEQMGSIAETVVKLSEQSQSIGDIVATVTDLAEQSNLLAVNAAIEAARAGEHGKGFVVVAQEIKSLADQSKHATAQVRGLLNDIQRAISSAVMATEQGSKSVEAGVLQSQEASEAIRSLASTIEAGSQAALQIAASSQQQSVGMDQVATAMENIKRASVQNVGSTKQTEIAAKNLHDVGQKLKELVERYRV